MDKSSESRAPSERNGLDKSSVASPPKKIDSGELKRFLVSGGSAVACDTLVYALLFAVAVPPSIAKAISFISGTVLAFFLNKFWTFRKPKRSHAEVVKFICLYASTLGANIFVNRFVLDHAALIVPAIQPVSVQFAFLTATGTSTVLNYLGQKFWVFKKGKSDFEGAKGSEDSGDPTGPGRPERTERPEV